MIKKVNSKKTAIKKKALSTYKKTTHKLIQKDDYLKTLQALKNHIQETQIQAIMSANKVLVRLYWDMGKIISEKQKAGIWSIDITEKLAKDLQNFFPAMSVVALINVKKMVIFYESYDEVVYADQHFKTLPIFNIPWEHNLVLLQKLKKREERLWYAQKVLEYGWSKNMLETWIGSKLYSREGQAITNFKHTLPALHSDLAQQTFKDPYLFDFLTLSPDHKERDLENLLIANTEKLLLELGKGFAFVGRQYHLMIDDKSYYIDLLFYHLTLRCYVVVELKAREFDHKDVGQIGFYLSAVDDLIRDPQDKPTIGLLLCRTKANVTVEYAIRSSSKPIGVAVYEAEIMKKLPKELKGQLPTSEELEAEFDKVSDDTYEKIIKKKIKK